MLCHPLGRACPAPEALLVADRVVLIGGALARQVASWTLDLPKPRGDEVAALGALRIDILKALRGAVRRH